MLGVLEKPHRKRCCEVCCLPFPMRLARFGRWIPASVQSNPAEARVQSSSSTRRSRLRPVTQEDRLKKGYPPTKNPSDCNLHQRKKERFGTSTPSPASTLSIATASSARACCKQRAGFQRYFINSWIGEARSLPSVTAFISSRYRALGDRECGALPRPLCPSDTL